MPWEDQYDHIIVREIIAAALAARAGLYAHPALAEFAGNGGDKINKRLQVVLGKLEKAYGVSGVVKEEVGKRGRAGKKGAGATPRKTGANVKAEFKMVVKTEVKDGPRGKKRKLDEDELDDVKAERE